MRNVLKTVETTAANALVAGKATDSTATNTIGAIGTIRAPNMRTVSTAKVVLFARARKAMWEMVALVNGPTHLVQSLVVMGAATWKTSIILS